MSDPLATGDPFVEWEEANAARDEVDHDDELVGLAESVADSIRGRHPTTAERIDRWAREAHERFSVDRGDLYCPDPDHAPYHLGGVVELVAWTRKHWDCEGPPADDRPAAAWVPDPADPDHPPLPGGGYRCIRWGCVHDAVTGAPR